MSPDNNVVTTNNGRTHTVAITTNDDKPIFRPRISLLMCWWGFKVFLRVFGNLASRILADTLDASYKMCTTLLCPCRCSNTANSTVTVEPHQRHMSDNTEMGEFLIYYPSTAQRTVHIHWIIFSKPSGECEM